MINMQDKNEMREIKVGLLVLNQLLDWAEILIGNFSPTEAFWGSSSLTMQQF